MAAGVPVAFTKKLKWPVLQAVELSTQAWGPGRQLREGWQVAVRDATLEPATAWIADHPPNDISIKILKNNVL
jgi:hypothetical protein